MGHAFRKRKPYIICINRMLYNCFREVNKRAKDGQILYDIFIFVSVVLFLFFFVFVFCLKLNADLELLLVRVFFWRNNNRLKMFIANFVCCLHGLPGVNCIADDVLTYERDGHNGYLEGFMERCRLTGIESERLLICDNLKIQAMCYGYLTRFLPNRPKQ